MRIIEQSYEIIDFYPEIEVRKICRGYCKCYATPMPETFEAQCDLILRHRNHGSPLEHGYLTVDFTTNLGVTHELVRHRHTAYSQESTRYCNYSKDKFDNQLTFVQNEAVIDNKEAFDIWLSGRERDEDEYMRLLGLGLKPEQARGGLPKDLRTSIQVSTNLREWHDIFELRCSKQAHYQIRALMLPLLRYMQQTLPCIFDDID